MLRRRIYYSLKPFVPWGIRMGIRRHFALRKRMRTQHLWPINESSRMRPKKWIGWPEGKQFAFILSHDVEGRKGLAQVEKLAKVEMELGFRSSFNFIPEGEYKVPSHLIEWLKKNNFEVGVHDLRHDGKLFGSREHFNKSAKRINEYLKKWEAEGYRSGFMLHNLEWFHELNILYDASTFDSDPFEPQPDPANTIFPFWVPNPKGENHDTSSGNNNSSAQGYVELPYTLAQDSTIFLLFKEDNNYIWEHKTDWLAKNGGMVFLNLHPDYVNFTEKKTRQNEFSISRYKDFLNYIKNHYKDKFWHCLPRDVATYVKKNRESVEHINSTKPLSKADLKKEKKRKIWIDLENTPHIPFFNPIKKELEKLKFEVVLTARDAYQTCDMADLYKLQYKRIGRHYGKNKLLKLIGLLIRTGQLVPFALRERPMLSLNHGSRTHNFVSNLLHIPTLTISDYEHASQRFIWKPTWTMVPKPIAETYKGADSSNLLRYDGLKEDVYAPQLKIDGSIKAQLGIREGEIMVTVRPPATEAHYHNPEAEELFRLFMERINELDHAMAVLLPRNERQKSEIKMKFSKWFEKPGKIVIPNQVVDGMNLVWHSDLVVSGGGTMNREAAALGVPVYSIFRGTAGAVDKKLESEGRLVFIQNPEDVEKKILIVSRDKTAALDQRPRKALIDIIKHISIICHS